MSGLLDWELSTLGHPLADLGFCVMPWLTSPDEYGGLMGSGWEGTGVPTRAEFEAEYHAHARPTAPLGAFHMAFALFRFAVIFVGIADRARAGNASSDEAATLAPLAERFAIRGLEVIAKDDDIPVLFMFRAQTLLELGRTQDALADYRRVEKLAPDSDMGQQARLLRLNIEGPDFSTTIRADR